MDFSSHHSSLALSFSDRPLSSLSSPDHSDNVPSSRPSSFSSDFDPRNDRLPGPFKLARTDSFSRHAELKMHLAAAGNGTLGSLVRSNSMHASDGRAPQLGCSPTNSSASDGALLGSEPRLMRNESSLSYPGSGAPPRLMSYHQQGGFPFRSSGGLPLSMSREMANHLGMHDGERGAEPGVFTALQLRELQYHALIFKYLVSGVNVPPELVQPIRASVAALAGSHHLAASIGWGNYHLGYANATDPEPGRCRRTDGKKWRCSRDVVPDQKYCERHINRGRNRRKAAESNQTAPSSHHQSGAGAAANSASSSSGASTVTCLTAGKAAPTTTSAAASSLRPSTALNVQQQRPSLDFKSYSATTSPNCNGGLSIGSSVPASQFHVPLQSSLSAKDFRYLNGDLTQEQIFFSEASGSIRTPGLGQESQSMSGLSVLSSANNAWRSMQQQQSRVPSPLQSEANRSSSAVAHHSSHHLRSMLVQDSLPMLGQDAVNLPFLQQQHQQSQHHSFLGGGFGAVEAVNVGRESEGQPLRHFFDDWPRSTGPSWSDVEEDRSNRSSSTTQLSISIPMTSSDFTSANASSPRDRGSVAGRESGTGGGAGETTKALIN